MKRILFSLIFLSYALPLVAQQDLITTTYNPDKKTKAKLTALFNHLPNRAYYPVRLTLKNDQPTERTWSLQCESTSNLYTYSHNGSLLESNFSYSCPAGQTKVFDILVPVVTNIPYSRGSGVETEINFTLKSGTKTSQGYHRSTQQIEKPYTLLSNDLFIEHASKLDASLYSSHSGYSRTKAEYASSFTPSAMPADWRAYLGYDALVCTDYDWHKISTTAQLAILEWNRLGGTILILKLNASTHFKSLNIHGETSNKDQSHLTRSHGSVILKSIAQINSKSIPKLITSTIETPTADEPRNIQFIEDYDSGKWPAKLSMGNLNFNPTFLMLILIAFGILVGPVNLFIFAKSGQRYKLFITTPIIALGTSIVLISIIIFQDGFGGKGKRVQLIELRANDGENKAYIKQEQIARTGVLLNGSFETSSPVSMNPLPLAPSRFTRVTKENAGGNANYIANHGEGGLAGSGDWFQSRSEHAHYLESIVPTRSRIKLKSTSGAPVLNSSFNHSIDTLFYLDPDGNYWQSSAINPGESATLSPMSPTEATSMIHATSSKFSTTLSHQFHSLSKRKGHFFAVSQSAPAIETLDSIEWVKTDTIITGPVVR